ncbi:MAG: cation:proton antiporter [Pseudomonadota bacterium]
MEPAAWHGETLLLVVLLGIGAYALCSNLLARAWITLPMVFVAFGYAISGPVETLGHGADLSHLQRLIAEVTLILVLFADASHVRFKSVRMNWILPARMLVIGLPLTIALGTLLVFAVNPAAGIGMALLTAAVLTPTDAALGQSFVGDPRVPVRLSETINVESGLNDGLVLPFVILGATLASMSMGGVHASDLPSAVLGQLAIAALVGIGFGWITARLLGFAQRKGWASAPAQGIVFVAAAFAAFLASQTLGGNGFIATFVAGMVFGNTYRHDPHSIRDFMEGIGQLLTIAAFLIFGAFLLPAAIAHMTWVAVAVAVGFLTFVRMVPIWLSLLGTETTLKERLVLGWFGPRGIASLLFTLIIMDEFDFPAEQELLACVAMTVVLSILAHGFSSAFVAQSTYEPETVD